ncbi:NAC domain containing protein 2, Arabidopsis NAC domain containing protein 78 [Hibiscus trionum]|uniref:NAC domain containing protein 2, Arabidopsis NAC domain containing protein 78 n=1 Tax=Hibiscus trionum TaxID=183268 RepID=A0A9W7HWS8_HIBTR|nr:NAC domain containing protein 2, Arabidopsis NAC domain containing protein 78 [Hibiscus trionum]
MGRDSGSATSLAPGFRFHPTDEELVRYYLKRKILNKPSFDLISVIDIYRSEPWDLPDKSKLKSRDLEWYFFSALDKKYGNGSRTNRATERGYWKTTGKDRAIRFRERVVGMKKTLVYHKGRAPRGERSNWVMHEYRLTDEALEKDIQQDAFVLCRVFQKSGSGPKNGEQYGAPFIEEEWGDDEAVIVPGQHDASVYEEAANDDAFVEVNDIDQNLDIGNPSENNIILPSNVYYGESSNCVEHSMEFKEDYQKPTCMHITEGDSKSEHKLEVSDLPEPNATVANVKPIKDEYVFEPIEDINSENYVLEDPYQDVTDYLPINDDELFLEANDFSNHIDPNSEYFDIGEYLSFDDADDQLLAFDYDQIVGSDITVSGQEPLTQTHTNEGIEQEPNASEHIEEHGNSEASSSKQELEATKVELGTKYPFIKQASQMLGSFPAPPAFASEFPSKDATRKLNSALQASSSGHVMAGMIRITNTASSGNRLDWSYNKNGSVNIVLSFNLPQGDINSSSFLPMASLLSGKTRPVVSRGWFFSMLILVLIISASLKMGSCICSRYGL